MLYNGITEKETIFRGYGRLNYYGKDVDHNLIEYGNKWGVARFLFQNGKLRFGFEENGRGFATSPVNSIKVIGKELTGLSKNGSEFSATLFEETGIWATPNKMIAIGYHKGWVLPSKINSEVTPASVEIIVSPDDNNDCNIILSIGEGVKNSYILTPTEYEYNPVVMMGEDGYNYEYYKMSIKTANSIYEVILKP